ncbi:MAG: radical SAM protein [Dehalococcoidia bacterium]|nr:MAG: radical SAM protein [Dehalococcoidia bacterium]
MEALAEKILLVNPNQMKPAVAPLALDYLASSLGEKGFEVDLLDLCFFEHFAQEIDRYFSRNSVSAIAITLRNSDDTHFAGRDFFLPRFKEIIDRLKERTPSPLILGGAGFSIMPEAILEYCGLDLGIWGEGEYSLPLLVGKIVAGEDYYDVPGLVYRGEKGFRRNPPYYLNLKNMSSPERSAVDNRRYFAEGGMGSIEAKRGCPKGCIYCADPLGKGRRVRCRSPRGVVDEIESLLEMGIDHLHFCDSEFNFPPAHAEAVCLEIIRRGLGPKLRWYAYCSPVPFSEELAILFEKAGCAGINFGVDSGTDFMLRSLGRDFNVEDLGRTARICHRQGIVFMYDLLLGGPGETRDSLRETIETMKRLSPSRVGASMGVRVFPRTKMAALVRKQGPMVENPNLHGAVDEKFLAPIFYLSSALGDDAPRYLASLVADDERFFSSFAQAAERNYNYNENLVLVEAIKNGYRGAFWDILRRLAEKG